MSAMIDLDTFVDDCRSAVKADPSHRATLEIVSRAFRDPSAVLAAVGEPTESGIVPLHQSKELTMLNVIWRPGMTIMPHTHEMWSIIGIYTGREDNIFWRRIQDDPQGRIEAAGARAVSTGDVVHFGDDIIHSVTNPIMKLTGAIHIYGGDFFEVERSEWDAETLVEHQLDITKVRALFGQ